MPQFLITVPDGRKFRLTGPDQQGAVQALKKHLGSQTARPPPVDPQEDKADREDFEPVSQAEDIARSAATGARQGAEGLLGGAGDANSANSAIAERVAAFFGADPETAAMIGKAAEFVSPLPGAPTGDQIREVTNQVFGEPRVPETRAGQFARAGGQFAASAAVPGGAVRRAAAVAVPAIASEGAGQLAEGTGFEDKARLFGGVAGGIASAGRAQVQKVAKEASKSAPQRSALSQEVNAKFANLRDKGIAFDNNQYALFVRDLARDARRKGFRGSTHKEALDVIDDLASDINTVIDFDTINGRISSLGEIARDSATKGDARLSNAFNFIRTRLMAFEDKAPFTANSNITGREKAKLLREAKELSLRNIKAREIENSVASADVAVGGVEAGQRAGIRKLLRSKRGRQLFKSGSDERALLVEVANGRKGLQALSRVGLDLTSKSGNALLVPLVGAGAANALGGPGTAAALTGAGTVAKVVSPARTQRALDQASGAIRSGALKDKGAIRRQKLLNQSRRLLSLSAAE